MTTMRSSRQRQAAMSRLLTAYVATGLFFMLIPGTFLGVWNLLQVSAHESVSLVPPAWIQAHGHAQIFGWIGTFILGIGFYSIPMGKGGLTAAWTSWGLWTTGVALRWGATVYEWHWRTLVPASAVLELVAFGAFLVMVSKHRPAGADRGFQPWVRVVLSASLGFLATLVANLGLAIHTAMASSSPAIAHGPDQRYLVLAAWGFLAPFVWGFSTRWLPVLMGLEAPRVRAMTAMVALNTAGVVLALAGWMAGATAMLLAGAGAAVAATRLFERGARPAKTRGVHASFPVFVRLAYVWLIAAAFLGVAAARWDSSGGIWGASRHAFTVGFVSTMVFSIGQRVLPQFAAEQPLWSPGLMFVNLSLLTVGCALRVSSEVLAYQHYAAWAWAVLPVSAIVEMAAVTVFALNLGMTLVRDRDTAPVATVA
jgi:hypothetical protein